MGDRQCGCSECLNTRKRLALVRSLRGLCEAGGRARCQCLYCGTFWTIEISRTRSTFVPDDSTGAPN